MTHRIAWAVCAPDPAFPPDNSAAHFAPIAAAHGLTVVATQWDDPAIDWASFDMVLIRSTWDYHTRPDDFLRWLDGLSVPVWNPPDLIRWNMHKRYLLEISEVAVVSTQLFERGSQPNLGATLTDQGWGQAVIKPAISASAFNTFRVDAANLDFAAERLGALLDGMDMLIQPFLPAISAGEWSLLFFRDVSGQIAYSHAVLKIPQYGDMRVQAEYGGETFAQTPPQTLIDDAQRLLESVRFPWLYARVDGLAQNGHLLLMELELIEPELFLEHDPGAGDRFALAIRSLLD